MKQLNQKVNIILIALFISGVFFSCKKTPNNNLKTQINVFKPELFKASLDSQLVGARGYAFVVTHNGQIAETSQFGIGSIQRNDTLPMTINSIINIASVTKTITATSFIRLMRYRDEIELDGVIGPWLPNNWTIDDDIRNLTFRELLTHTSGIRSSSTSWSGMKTVAANPITAAKTFSYSNTNFGLFRAMIPKIHNKQLVDQKEGELSTDDFELWLSNRYIQIIQDDIFKKIDLQDRACAPVPNAVQMFNEAPNPIQFFNTGDWTNSCAAGGFYMSTRDMAKFIVYLTHENNFINGFINEEERQMMDNFQLGFNRNFTVTGGMALGHGGLLYQDVNANNAQDAGEPGIRTAIFKFPNKVELALSINSMSNVGNGDRNINQICQTAYNNAWVIE